MNTDKTPATLATAKHGGCVQLATVPYDRARELIGDAYNAGTHGIGYSQQIMELHDAVFAAQPSPGGQGDAVRHSPEDYRDARIILARNMKRVAGKHNVPNLAADADVVESGEEYDFWMDAAYDAVREALAARQPVAEPVAWVPAKFFDKGIVAMTARRTPPSAMAVELHGKYVPLFDAPPAQQPAQAVDLGELIEQIAEQWDGCSYDAVGETIDVGQAIRAAGKRLLDSHSAGGKP